MGRKAVRKTVKFVAPPEILSSSAGNNEFVSSKLRKTFKTPAGKGLGKAGAKRLGRLLKRAIPGQEGQEGARGDVSVPKTPFRLFKHQIRSTGVNGGQASAPKRASPQINQLILSLVSQCKHKRGMTMAELKHTLASEGYDVAKNNKQLTVAAKRLLSSGRLVQSQHKLKLNEPSVITRQRRAQIKKETLKVPSPKAPSQPTKPKPTTVTSKTPKTQTQARKTPKPTEPERKRPKSIKRKVKTQTRQQKKRRATTTGGRKKLKATKKHRAASIKRRKSSRRRRAVKKRQNTHKTQRSKRTKQKQKSRLKSSKKQRQVTRNGRHY